MTATINECLDQLKIDLDEALVSNSHANKVWPFRTLYDKLPKAVSISHISTVPGENTIGGKGWNYDFAAYMTVQHDGTEAELEAAERAINTLENEIISALESRKKNGLWNKIEFERPSIKPGAPPSEPGVRYGAVYFRLILK